MCFRVVNFEHDSFQLSLVYKIIFNLNSQSGFGDQMFEGLADIDYTLCSS